MVLNALPDFHVPSMSDLLNETREYEGGGDEVTGQHLHRMWEVHSDSDTEMQSDPETDDDNFDAKVYEQCHTHETKARTVSGLCANARLSDIWCAAP